MGADAEGRADCCASSRRTWVTHASVCSTSSRSSPFRPVRASAGTPSSSSRSGRAERSRSRSSRSGGDAGRGRAGTVRRDERVVVAPRQGGIRERPLEESLADDATAADVPRHRGGVRGLGVCASERRGARFAVRAKGSVVEDVALDGSLHVVELPHVEVARLSPQVPEEGIRHRLEDALQRNDTAASPCSVM